MDKINLLNFDGKEKEGDIKVTNNSKLNFLKDENIQQNKKIEELQKHLDNIKNLEKEKEKEINILLNKIINSMKNNLKIIISFFIIIKLYLFLNFFLESYFSLKIYKFYF